MTVPKKRGSGHNPVAVTLQELFRVFDKDGSGELQLGELYAELSSVPGVILTPLQRERLKNQFAYMDANGDGSVTYPEFEKAALAALSSDFSSLQKQRECESFGYDFFTLLALSRRAELAKTQKHNVIAEFDKMKEMSRMAFLTLDMMEQERKKHNETADILRSTTVDFQRSHNGLANERAAVLARAQFSQTLHPELNNNRADSGEQDLHQSVEDASRCQRRKFKRRLIRDLQPLPHSPVPSSTTTPVPSDSSTSFPSTSTRCHKQQQRTRRQQVPGLVLAPLPERSTPPPPDSPISSIQSVGSSSCSSTTMAAAFPLSPPYHHHALSSSSAAPSCTTTTATAGVQPLKASRLLLPVLFPHGHGGRASDHSKIRERRLQKLKAAGAGTMMQRCAL